MKITFSGKKTEPLFPVLKRISNGWEDYKMVEETDETFKIEVDGIERLQEELFWSIMSEARRDKNGK